MSMTALQGFDAATASAILAAAALKAGPHIEDAPVSVDQQSVDNVLAELRDKLGIAPSDASPKARALLDEALAVELDRVGFSATNFQNVEKALGAQGELPVSAYKIIFVSDVLAQVHEQEKFVRRSILDADQVEHINSEDESGTTRISLFVKLIGKGSKSHWLLIQANRVNLELHIVAVWRVFPQVVDLVGAVKPFDILRAFANRYGRDIAMSDGNPKRFIAGVDVGSWDSVKADLQKPGSVLAKEVSPERDRSVRYVETGSRIRGRAILAAAYAIDIRKYLADKRIYVA